MNNTPNITSIMRSLKKRYNKDVHLTEIHGGNDKNVYLAKLNTKTEFVVLVDKKNSLTLNYRILESNYIQKDLFNKKANVADVVDVFEDKEIGIITCHQYLNGVGAKVFDSHVMRLCGIAVAKLHSTNIGIKYYLKEFSHKYIICSIIKFLNVNSRNIRSFIFDKNWRCLKKGICHRDLNLGNFIFIGNIAYLIDFDRNRFWPYVYEIERFIKDKDNILFVKDFISGYESIRKFDANEKKYLIKAFPVLKDIF